MSLHARPCEAIPEQTMQVAQAAFPKGNPYMRMRDALGPIYTNPTFAALFSRFCRKFSSAVIYGMISLRGRWCQEGGRRCR
jgi:hypothetical protein